MDTEDIDSFTQQLLERTKVRQANLDKKISRTPAQTAKRTSSSSSNGSRKRPSPLREDNKPVEDNDGKRYCSPNKNSPLKKKVSFNTHEENVDSKENTKRESSNLKGRLKKLAMLHSGDVIDSPPPKPQRLYPDLTPLLNDDSNSQTQTPLKKSNRLASLSETYKQLEDETNPSNAVKSVTSSKNDTKPEKQTFVSKSNSTSVSTTSSFSKALEKFQTPTNKQQAQGFTHSPSKSKLEYEFNKNDQQNIVPKENFRVPAPPPPPMPKENELKKIITPEKVQSPLKTQSKVNSQEKLFSPKRDIPRFDIQLKTTASNEKTLVKRAQSPKQAKIDPSILPLSARVALFEKATHDEAKAAAASRAMIGMITAKKSPQKTPTKICSPQKSKLLSPSVGKATENIHRQLQTHGDDWKKNQIAAKVKSERKNEMNLLLNRWEQATEIMEENILSSQIKKSSSASSQIRLSKESSASSELEPLDNLESESDADIESEIETDEESSNEVFQPIKSASPAKAVAQIENYSTESEDEVDENNLSELLDEAIDEQETSECSSNEAESSFMKLTLSQSKKLNPAELFKSPAEKTFSAPAVSPSTSECDEGPLLHTVSFYRKQKQEYNTPPVRTIVRKEVRKPSLPRKQENAIPLKQKIKALQDDITAQQIIISQTSQALNLCRSSVEFHGSAEQVEGEKLLLIATHKRQAAMNELQKVKTEGALGKANEDDGTSGSVSIKNICLPLKRDYLKQSDKGKSGDFVHFFLCLIKYGTQVVATQMLSTKDNIREGMLSFPNLINIRDLNYNFNILLEVYGLQTRRDQVANDRTKTLNKKEKSRLNLTPLKKLSKSDKMFNVRVQSPGGPGAVRSSSFALIGYTNINLKTISKKQWVLDKIPFVSPLDGNLSMSVHCLSDYHMEERGFLTLFDDVSGFGAWHRRWFVLNGTTLFYWKYPDDEKNKREPIGSIYLQNCVTANVGLVPRDVCARPNTFMLVTVRAPHHNDVETLVCQNFGTYTAIKHLLSADSKEERLVWCDVLNSTLTNIRTWNSDALTPFDLNSGGTSSDE